MIESIKYADIETLLPAHWRAIQEFDISLALENFLFIHLGSFPDRNSAQLYLRQYNVSPPVIVLETNLDILAGGSRHVLATVCGLSRQT